MSIKQYPFIVTQGHQVASGMADNSPFPDGTINLQTPYFKALGLDLTSYFKGTINAQFNCNSIELLKWDLALTNVHWLPNQPSEDFLFAYSEISYKEKRFPAIIYQPRVETKLGHFQPTNILELIAPKVNGLHYGSKATLIVQDHYLSLTN